MNNNSERKVLGPVVTFAIGEGAILFNAYLASTDPKGYGGLLALLTPVASLSATTPAVRWTGLVAGESLAAYNIWVLNKNIDSEIDIFRRNIIGWHIFGALILTADYFFPEKKYNSKLSYSIIPMGNGGFAQITYLF